MANIQHIADRIFRHVDKGHLPAGYALAMGAVIDAYDDDPCFHEWANDKPGSAVEKLIACMVRKGKWGDHKWLTEYIAADSRKEAS